MHKAIGPVVPGSRLERPPPLLDPAKGLLHDGHFQLAYACNDIGRAAVFRSSFGVTEFRPTQGDAQFPPAPAFLDRLNATPVA